MIVAIPQAEVHRICSGQVVVDLATACKELIENALDAGATKIDVRLENYGADLIECVDNGKGINPKNHQAIALKYHTSKLASFNDLDTLTSFGFRGEALSSLCELSESFQVITRIKEEDSGHLLEFNNSGRMILDEPTARLTGTTIRISNLFSTMPVRRKEMLRSLKRQYAKMLSHLQAYAVMQTNVRMSVTMTTTKGKKQRVLNTQASGKLKNNLISIFGNKFATSLTSVEFQKDENEDKNDKKDKMDILDKKDKKDILDKKKETNTSTEESKESPKRIQKSDSSSSSSSSISSTSATSNIIAHGWISKPGDGIGRSTSERQFVFINQRPVDMPKISKLFNEVWRQYEMKQKPAFVLNFCLPPSSYDINIAPNKREVFLVDEVHLHNVLRAKLETIWEPTRYTFKVKQVQSILQPVILKKSNTSRRATGSNVFVPLSEASSSSSSSTTSSFTSSSSSSSSSSSIPNPKTAAKKEEEETEINVSQSSSITIVGQKRKTPSATATSDSVSIGGVNVPNTTNEIVTTSKRSRHTKDDKEQEDEDEDEDFEDNDTGKKKTKDTDKTIPMNIDETEEDDKIQPIDQKYDPRKNIENLQSTRPTIMPVSSTNMKQLAADLLKWRSTIEHNDAMEVDDDGNDGNDGNVNDGNVNDGNVNDTMDMEIDSNIRRLSKNDFLKMSIIGQFNLGFVIAKHQNDLYIMDQHACDEKFNFERLQRDTVVHQQPLIAPLPFEATASEELTIIDHLDLFKKNGFHLNVNHDAPVGTKLKLVAVPFSKKTNFGIDDVHELADLLAACDSSRRDTIRPPKITSMFASRSCRMSIMIGRALNRREQIKTVRKLATMNQPWNCPHGRPTMQHLVALTSKVLASQNMSQIE